MTGFPVLDHVALSVPNVDEHVERPTTAFGMVAQFRSDDFALVVDSRSDLLELTSSDAAGMETTAAPHRRDFAGMYTSFLQQSGGVEIQLVKYD